MELEGLKCASAENATMPSQQRMNPASSIPVFPNESGQIRTSNLSRNSLFDGTATFQFSRLATFSAQRTEHDISLATFHRTYAQSNLTIPNAEKW